MTENILASPLYGIIVLFFVSMAISQIRKYYQWFSTRNNYKCKILSKKKKKKKSKVLTHSESVFY